jgi:GNAT superfamily N-acetyltransferase
LKRPGPKGSSSRRNRRTPVSRRTRAVAATGSRTSATSRGLRTRDAAATRITGAIALRPATRADVPTILGLIRGIAEYERLAHEVEATEALLREHGFGPRRVFEAILAERDGQALGFALYFFTFSTFTGRPTLYLEDLFVVPPERRGGIGSRLLTRLAQIAVERECGRMEWSVLDWNTPARDLYFKLGAKSMDQWTVFRMTPDAFGRLAREGL